MSQVGRLSLVISQIRFAREYTLSLLNDLSPEDWFRQPAGGVSHLAWQMGHLAMAQYGLCLFRMRGRAEVDLELMSSSFRRNSARAQLPIRSFRRILLSKKFAASLIESSTRPCWNCQP
ncbi:MAG: DinB family protein [Planctomycetaceae bacterium]